MSPARLGIIARLASSPSLEESVPEDAKFSPRKGRGAAKESKRRGLRSELARQGHNRSIEGFKALYIRNLRSSWGLPHWFQDSTPY